MLGQIVDWFYGQIVGFLGNFFSEMGNMGAELFAMNWVQSVVLFFSYLGWALFAIGLVVACFECGVEYSGGRGNVKETALNAMKGFLAVSLFTQVPVRLYELAVSLQADLTAGITGGFVIDAFRAERWLEPAILAVIQSAGGAAPAGGERRRISSAERHEFAAGEVKAIVGRIWKWVIAGVAVGALLHGFVPDDWFARVMTGAWWNVPAAVFAGMPLYTNVTGIVPVMEGLLAKGLPLGTTLAFAMSTVGASFPEFVMLRQVMTARLLTLFFLWLIVCFTMIGWILNLSETLIY